MSTPHPTRTEDVFSTLRHEVLTGQYRPGERLPSERELALRFETGRGAVREALRKLETLGLTKSARGGSRVAAVDEANLDVLGPLLDLHPVPDAELVDQCLKVLELVKYRWEPADFVKTILVNAAFLLVLKQFSKSMIFLGSPMVMVFVYLYARTCSCAAAAPHAPQFGPHFGPHFGASL